MKKFAIIILSGLIILSCSEIPEKKITVVPKLYEKLVSIQGVKLSRNTQLFGIDCRSFEPGLTYYYLVSSDGDMSEDYAKWSCNSEFSYLKCPDFKVIATSNVNEVIVSVTRGDPDDYSMETVMQCARKAIEFAPTKIMPTSDKVANRDSWK